MRRLISRLRADQKGVTIVEFAIIAPTLMILLMGIFDLGNRALITSVVQGELQKSGRDSALENGGVGSSALDARVTNRVKRLASNATFTYTRKNVASFTRAGQAEKFTDGNANNIKDAGECFQDENGNGVWDATSGREGQGGADDITRYTVVVSIPLIFPLRGLINLPETQTITTTTVLRNQPFGEQDVRTATVVCI
jgi:Flp pilus assembly protein TadG